MPTSERTTTSTDRPDALPVRSPSSSPPASDPAHIAALLAAILVAAVLRLYHLGAQSLWIDEVFTWLGACVGQPIALRDLLIDLHGPLYSVILHAWTDHAGDSEWALRLPSAVFGIATVPAMAWLAKRWLGREAELPAAWLTAGSPFLVWYSQEVRNYSLLLLTTVVASGALVGLLRAPRVRGAIGYAAALVAALMSNWSVLMLMPVHAAWWWGPPEQRRRRLVLLAGVLALLVLAVIPFVPGLLGTWDWSRLSPGHGARPGETALRGATTFHPAAVPFGLHAFAVGYTLGPTLRELKAHAGLRTLAPHAPGIAVVALVFGVLGVLGLRALARRRRLIDTLLWLLVPFALVSWLALENFHVFHPRYVMVAYPAFLLVLAAAFADARPRVRGALALAVGALWALSLSHHYRDPRYGKEDYRGMGALLRARATADERILSINTDDPLQYYYRGPLRVVPVWLGLVDRPARLDQLMGEAMAGAAGVWVVQSRPEDLDPSGAFARRLEARYPDAERIHLEGVRIWHVRFRRAP